MVTLAAGGYLVLAFGTDNPGSWLMHCHVAWHASEGLAVQFVEREGEIGGLIEVEGEKEFDRRCEAWREYDGDKVVYQQADSGI